MKTLRVKALLVLLAAAFSANAAPLPKPDRGGVPESKLYDYGVMGPPATPAIVSAANAGLATALPAGPYQANWNSIRKNYQPPAWFAGAKFGIFLHWGVYAVPAYHNEWYEKHMYDRDLAWHTEHFGLPEKFGYKDFIPQFTAEKFDPDAWAELFRRAGARLVMPTAQHHDNFALWDSAVTPFNAKRMGPHRDLIGDLGAAVRRAGMRFGVSNHGVENFAFVNPTAQVEARLRERHADLFDPAWADFYNVADRSPLAMSRFLSDWLARNFELIDKYQPDLLYFDNGVNLRVLDPLKERVAAYYYNRASGWGKQVSISTKWVAYAPDNDDSHQLGSIIDFEKVGTRSPSGIRPSPWMVDDTIGSTWGYTAGMRISSAASIIGKLVDTVSKGGFYLLNIAPKADGMIPDDQQRVLLGVGAWLQRYGDAIYDTHPWTRFGDGDWRFTVKGEALYAIGKAGGDNTLASLTPAVGNVTKVEVVGGESVAFSQDAAGLHLQLLPTSGAPLPVALKISGLQPR
ncbi:alpha-L-fucosidase [Massilia terrae]|uniref:alpha-L-fucosidase n=1 Tax=Massilia terrae TaxID=1811224 RepID=A0ABT2CTC4_9BURK|nr:alpha-L-fucosidase [Massilia terrae]MCS0657217.1 alpha-L-fucosidase [Massilia terrae]